jgi:hypothetical protein
VSRTIIIGDVHGCAAELEQLLKVVGWTQRDRLVFVGDLIARGPDSVGVLNLYRASGAVAVMGNHEARMLRAREARAQGTRGPRLGPAHYRLLHQLSEADWSLIQSFPLHLDLPAHGVRIVHAGIVPRVPFEQQDPWTLMHIRSLTSDGQPSDRVGDAPWAAHYEQGPHIVFGHNSRLQLQMHRNATGLDTGCVYGGTLTAMVLEGEQRVPMEPEQRQQLLFSVRAHQRYYVGVEFPPSSKRSVQNG